MLMPIVSSVRAVNELTNLPVLGVIGRAFPTRRRARSRRLLLHFVAATACLVLALGVVLILSRSGVRLNIQAIQSLVKA